MITREDCLLTKNDLSMPLLKALGELTDRERECWIDRHILGVGFRNNGERAAIQRACERLAELLGLQP